MLCPRYRRTIPGRLWLELTVQGDPLGSRDCLGTVCLDSRKAIIGALIDQQHHAHEVLSLDKHRNGEQLLCAPGTMLIPGWIKMQPCVDRRPGSRLIGVSHIQYLAM